MNNREIKWVSLRNLLVVVGILTICAFGRTVMAADDPTGNVVGFNYKVEYPDNQIGANKGYFDLVVAPGTEQAVTLVLSNPGTEKISVNVALNGAKTNPNGVVEYGETDIENDASLKFPFEDVVSGPETVELAGGEVKKVAIQVKMPETSFEGVILGGIQLKKANQETKGEATKGATVRNEYSYVVGMVLKNSEDEVQPEIQLNKASGSQRNYRNSVSINLSNSAAVLLTSKVGIETQVMKKGSKEVLYERKQTGMSFAPNSQLDFYVSMNGEKMVVGDYTADVLVTIGDQKWEKSLDFTITKEEADKYNKRDVGLVQDRGLDWKLVAWIVVGGVSGVILIFGLTKVMGKAKKSRETKVSNSKQSSKKSSRNKKK